MPKKVFERPKAETETVHAGQPLTFYFSDQHAVPPNALRVRIGSEDKLVKDLLSKPDATALKALLDTLEESLMSAAGFAKKSVADEDE